MDIDTFSNYLDSVLVCLMFFLFLAIWKWKRIAQARLTGIDPEVIRNSSNRLQKYIYRIFRFFGIYAIFLIIAHTFKFDFFSFFSIWEYTNSHLFDLLGFSVGIFGLAICFWAQKEMGNSWRVGIDVENQTDLITSGLFKIIRNPTYSGLLMLFLGLWLIWSSWAVSLQFILFFLIIEVQVRCEEEYLHAEHGDKYLEYIRSSFRYLPYVY